MELASPDGWTDTHASRRGAAQVRARRVPALVVLALSAGPALSACRTPLWPELPLTDLSAPPASGGDGAGGCPPGQVMCAGHCVDLTSDPDHCGSCDIACAPPAVCSL